MPAIFTRGRWECRDFKEPVNFAVLSNAGFNEVSEILELHSQSQHSDIPSTIPLMRNDVKNIKATGIVLPDILPGAPVNTMNDALVNDSNSVTSNGFVSQITVTEGESSKEGCLFTENNYINKIKII